MFAFNFLAIKRIFATSVSHPVPSCAFSLSHHWLQTAQRQKDYRKFIKENDPERHQIYLQKNRDRLQFMKENDPERYEEHLEKDRDRLKTMKENHPEQYQRRTDSIKRWMDVPENAARHREHCKQRYEDISLRGRIQQRSRDKYRNDPNFREEKKFRNRKAKSQERKFQNSSDTPKSTAQDCWKDSRKDNAKWKDKDHMLQAKALHKWLRTNQKARKLKWQTHQLAHSYPEKVEHFCSGCGFTHFGGKSVWWRRKSNPNLYDCHSSFASDWSRALPVGYEHIRFGGGSGNYKLKPQKKSLSSKHKSKSEQKSSGSEPEP